MFTKLSLKNVVKIVIEDIDRKIFKTPNEKKLIQREIIKEFERLLCLEDKDIKEINEILINKCFIKYHYHFRLSKTKLSDINPEC